MSRRNTTDPLLRAFLDAYKLNLLAIPRQGAQVGDVYVDTNKGVSAPGRLEHLLTRQFKMPRIELNEKLTEIATKQTRAIKLNAGLSLLEGFFGAIGADTVLGKIKAEYERKRASAVRFRLKNSTRDSVDPMAFGKALMPSRLNQRHPFVQPGNRYYVSIGVVRSKSITISAEDQSSNDISLDLGVLQDEVGMDGKIDVSRESTGEMTYQGPVPLAFGVELVEMTYVSDDGKFILAALPTAEKIRGAPKKIERDFIGDPKGDVFLDMID